MYQNKIVVRYADGRLHKGSTVDLVPNKESFHVMLAGEAPDSKPPKIRVADLKAVFFVRDFAGNPYYVDKKEFMPGNPILGRKIKVLFKDGELMVGTTNAYHPSCSGFFVSPADLQSNIKRCFVVTKATNHIKLM